LFFVFFRLIALFFLFATIFCFHSFQVWFLRDCLIRDYLIHDHLKLVNDYKFGLISLIVLISLTGFAKKLERNCFSTFGGQTANKLF